MATTVQDSEHRLLKVKEVADLLNLTPQTVYLHARTGRLPAPIVVGSAYRWRRPDIMAIVEQRQQ